MSILDRCFFFCYVMRRIRRIFLGLWFLIRGDVFFGGYVVMFRDMLVIKMGEMFLISWGGD